MRDEARRESALALRARDGTRMLPLEHASEYSIAQQGIVGACGKFAHHLADPHTTYCEVFSHDDVRERATPGAPTANDTPVPPTVTDFATTSQRPDAVVYEFGKALPTRDRDAYENHSFASDARMPISLLLASKENKPRQRQK